MPQLISIFVEAVGRFVEHEMGAAHLRHKAHIASLGEEIRQLLLQAAYLELAQAANRDFFDESMPLDFSEQVTHRLKRHKYSFAGAIKAVDITGLRPRNDDPKYTRIRDSQRDVLARRFEATRTKLGDALGCLVQASKVSVPTGIEAKGTLNPVLALLRASNNTPRTKPSRRS